MAVKNHSLESYTQAGTPAPPLAVDDLTSETSVFPCLRWDNTSTNPPGCMQSLLCLCSLWPHMYSASCDPAAVASLLLLSLAPTPVASLLSLAQAPTPVASLLSLSLAQTPVASLLSQSLPPTPVASLLSLSLASTLVASLLSLAQALHGAATGGGLQLLEGPPGEGRMLAELWGTIPCTPAWAWPAGCLPSMLMPAVASWHPLPLQAPSEPPPSAHQCHSADGTYPGTPEGTFQDARMSNQLQPGKAAHALALLGLSYTFCNKVCTPALGSLLKP